MKSNWKLMAKYKWVNWLLEELKKNYSTTKSPNNYAAWRKNDDVFIQKKKNRIGDALTYIITNCIIDIRWYFNNLWAIRARVVCKAPRIPETRWRITLRCHFVSLKILCSAAVFNDAFLFHQPSQRFWLQSVWLNSPEIKNWFLSISCYCRLNCNYDDWDALITKVSSFQSATIRTTSTAMRKMKKEK